MLTEVIFLKKIFLVSKFLIGLMLFPALLMIITSPSYASITPYQLWTTNGVTVCASLSGQGNQQILGKPNGEFFVVWTETRNSAPVILAQKFSSSGAPEWATAGITIEANPSVNPANIKAAYDSTGNLYVCWRDGWTNLIYAQKLSHWNGSVAWTVNGVRVGSNEVTQQSPAIAPDGTEGAYVVWQELDSSKWISRVQRIQYDGSIPMPWIASGTPVCTDTHGQMYPQMIADNANNVIIVWQDYRNAAGNYNPDIYAQKIGLSYGYQWGSAGIPVCNESHDQTNPLIASDGNNGAIVVWADARNGLNDAYGAQNIFAQRLDQNGNILWSSTGAPVCADTGGQSLSSFTTDTQGNSFYAWVDYRNTNQSSYVQKLTPSGSIAWNTSGLALCADGATQTFPSIVDDGTGGAIASFWDNKSSKYTNYVQKVSPSGTLIWPSSGFQVCPTFGTFVFYAALAKDLYGGTYAIWTDNRQNANYTVFVQDISDVPTSQSASAFSPVYVSSSGSDTTGDGKTSSTAFATIQTALNNVTAGGTVIVSGSITENNILWPSFANNVTLLGDGRNSTIISGNNMGRIFYIEASQVTIDSVSIINGNVADNNGGAIYVPGNTTLFINNSSLISNEVYSTTAMPDYRGGAIYCAGNATVIANRTRFDNNHAYDSGVIYGANTAFTATNCIFDNNSAADFGVSLIPFNAMNCTFYGNLSYFQIAQNITATNCAFASTNFSERLFSSAANLTNCVLNNTLEVTGTLSKCIFANPSFESTMDGSPYYLHLSPASPCINAGTAVGAPSIDYDGNIRSLKKTCDIGAFEYAGNVINPNSMTTPLSLSLNKPMNIPNPFKTGRGKGTTIIYMLANNGDIKLIIYDTKGRSVWAKSFTSGSVGGSTGENNIYWDGTDSFGNTSANGVYIYMVTSGTKVLSKGQMVVAN
jgi:hypothetical protein